jgi:hypothetical protein
MTPGTVPDVAGSSAVPATRRRALPALVVLASVVAGCGSSRTEIPAHLGTTVPGQPLLAATTTAPPADAGPTTTAGAGGPTTTSAFQTAGLKHTLAGGATVVVSYPNNNARPPKNTPPPPAGSNYAVVTVKLCAPKTGPIPSEIVDPARFSVEVPGQGRVAYDPAVPVMRGPALAKGATVNPGACLEATISYVIAGEKHIESISYDAGEGVFRWVS